MKIEENISLKPYNTFGINVIAKQLAVFRSVSELEEISAMPDSAFSGSLLVLGGGSNLLFTKNFDGLVIKNEIEGLERVGEDENDVYIKAGAGMAWHGLVMQTLAQGLSGFQNLALIPGTVGATPIQNIGAYGVEIKDVFHSLRAWHIRDKELVSFSNSSCQFGYRDSIFKKKYKGQFIITDVTYRLSKKHQLNTSYGAVNAELERMGVAAPTPAAVAEAVIHIRSSKLPDPKITGNAGSFFKNPVVEPAVYEAIKKEYGDVPGFAQPAGVKLAAGWLIEQCGWKGYRQGDAGCYPKQALVLVNYGTATGKEIFELSEEIISSVQNKFGVTLEREVNVC